MYSQFREAHAWVFDLDDTLYPPSARLFDQIIEKINDQVMRAAGVNDAEARQMRARFIRQYGTTLAGLMNEYNADPEPYLVDVHDIDLSALSPDPALRRALLALPGRRIVYTNGSRGHADQVLKARGLEGVFAARYSVEDAGFIPKPERAAFDRVFALDGLEPKGAVMVEDSIANLRAPREMGMRTLWVTPDPAPNNYADAATDDLAAFLNKVTG